MGGSGVNDNSTLLAVIGSAIIVAYLVPLILFITLYAMRSPWTSTELGKALMYQKSSFLLVVCVVIASIAFPGYFGRDWVRIVIFGGVSISLWVDVINLLHYQDFARANRRDRLRSKFGDDKIGSKSRDA